METQEKQIMQALKSFFREDSGDVVEYMESMLYEWYQHYALEHYPINHINDVVNGAFRVNDLLLKLNDAMLAMKGNKGQEMEQVQGDLPDCRGGSASLQGWA